MPRRLMLQGTGSDVGKSVLTAGLCRAFKKRGINVAPFKPQNMSNNAAVTEDGGEIGRAQWLQAKAACIAPSVHMNPVLLKPQSDTGAQVVVQGRVHSTSEAASYQAKKKFLLSKVMESYETLSETADLIFIEGAGSPAEVNLRAGDIANMGFALEADVPVALVGDINRGGVIASIVGTWHLLPEVERQQIKGFIINQFRGDISLFDGGIDVIKRDTKWRHFGTVPFLRSIKDLPAEDAVILENDDTREDNQIKIAVPLLPRIANFDDLDPLIAEDDVAVTVIKPGQVIPAGQDLIIIPGSKSTIADLEFMKQEGWDIDIKAHVRRGGSVLGICGGYQMLGSVVSDPDGIEGRQRESIGLSLLDVESVITRQKSVQETEVDLPNEGMQARGYEIHCGVTNVGPNAHTYMTSQINKDVIGVQSADGRIIGTYLHGLFENGEYRKRFLKRFSTKNREAINFDVKVEKALDSLASSLEDYLDLDQLWEIAGK
ncbi:cobyric acid synthase [Kordiimonas sp. SCSIO 12610]|uniref:cobyric acid synthase n=1 Tax=Kordiimonas sp. SCSIO 12610 TaxID=2829597 RepID=UPI002108ACF4|nr:cobyric acid synthase [Kordiimonas sp. SCSIO 12610]UTW55931.1 cobyric acid synthase [Kordiimonas sp. SCSIO 12610]